MRPRRSAPTAATAELQQAETVCGQYVDVIAHKYRAPAAGEAAPARLQAELTNRRQYASYLMELASTFKQAASQARSQNRGLWGACEAPFQK